MSTQPIFKNCEERDEFLRDLPMEKLDGLEKFYLQFPERSRVPYVDWMIEGINKEKVERNM